ncbi:hypothetical protein P879_03650 [Paragonimus westermani]|uniref:Dynein light chain n=1 Tax=Paragonimus westermani TaxID=34504 RepID=A0A8T0DMI8_9TREM|nr:hypothetical protein P879_03650 [Paragonimus westermani]
MVAVDIRHTELDDEMKAAAVEAATHASENFTTEKEMAAYIKSQFDKKFKPVWHCVAGRDFGSFVTHHGGHIIYFYIDDRAFLLFKTG